MCGVIIWEAIPRTAAYSPMRIPRRKKKNKQQQTASGIAREWTGEERIPGCRFEFPAAEWKKTGESERKEKGTERESEIYRDGGRRRKRS